MGRDMLTLPKQQDQPELLGLHIREPASLALRLLFKDLVMLMSNVLNGSMSVSLPISRVVRRSIFRKDMRSVNLINRTDIIALIQDNLGLVLCHCARLVVQCVAEKRNWNRIGIEGGVGMAKSQKRSDWSFSQAT
jgi:hypothetical protein